MGTKKIVKKVLPAEVLAENSLGGLEDSLAALQTTMRTTITMLGDAFAQRGATLTEICAAINEGKAELEHLGVVEKLEMSKQDLAAELDQAQRDHARALADIKKGQERTVAASVEDHADRLKDLGREHESASYGEKVRLEAEARNRKNAQDDEDRTRNREFEAVKAEMDLLDSDLARRAAELGSFDERVKAAEGKARGMAEGKAAQEAKIAEMGFESQIAILKSERDGHATTIKDLNDRLVRAETAVGAANDRANAIASASVQAASGKQALDVATDLARESARAPKR